MKSLIRPEHLGYHLGCGGRVLLEYLPGQGVPTCYGCWLRVQPAQISKDKPKGLEPAIKVIP